MNISNNKIKVLITAGPTYEKIDPVRFIGNYSSGKMGIALAEECINRGIYVELILGPVQIESTIFSSEIINITHVESAQDMYKACMQIYPQMNAAILCAAVADFTPIEVADHKIKRKGDELIIHLKPTKDIAKNLGQIKKNNQVLSGFALETNDEIINAKDKLERKNFDFIVLNSLNDKGAGFKYDTNKITIISKTKTKNYSLMSKKECAVNIIDELIKTIEKYK